MSKEGGGHGAPMWVLTYADMITVLMGFFVIMAAMSKPGETDRVVKELIEQFGSPDAMERYIRASELRRESAEKKETSKEPRPRPRSPSGPGQLAKVKIVREGNRLTVGGPLLFEPGEAQLLEEAREVLRAIADEIRGRRHLIEVRGYEPPGGLPAGSRFGSAGQIADARTRAVIDFFVTECNIRREYLRLVVGAPVETTAIPQLQDAAAPFERVEVTVLESTGRDYQPTSPGAATEP